MNTQEQKKLSDSLLAACKAAGIEKPKHAAQDKDGRVWHYDKRTHRLDAAWECLGGVGMTLLNHPPYAADWKESWLEWVESRGGMAIYRTPEEWSNAHKGEPLADVPARHPESVANDNEVIDACDIAYRKMNEEYAGRRTFETVYRRAWSDALAWLDGSELRKQAIERGHAEYVVDSDGKTTWQWKEAK